MYWTAVEVPDILLTHGIAQVKIVNNALKHSVNHIDEGVFVGSTMWRRMSQHRHLQAPPVSEFKFKAASIDAVIFKTIATF